MFIFYCRFQSSMGFSQPMLILCPMSWKSCSMSMIGESSSDNAVSMHQSVRYRDGSPFAFQPCHESSGREVSYVGSG